MFPNVWTTGLGKQCRPRSDLEEQSDQSLRCLPFCLHLLDPLLCGKTILFQLQQNYSNFLSVRTFRIFTVFTNSSYRATCTNLATTSELPHDKTNKMTVCPAKTQMSLGIQPVWSESLLCAQCVAKDPSFLHADSKDSDQTGHQSLRRVHKPFC